MTKREKILQGIMLLIAQEGVNGSPMSKLSKQIGIAVGTIYHHFKSKEAIINEIYVLIKQQVGAVILEHEGLDNDFKLEFKRVTRAIFNYYVNHPTEFSFLLQVEHSPIITSAVRCQADEYFAPVFAFYKRGIADSWLVDMDLTLMGILTYNHIITLVEHHLKGHPLSNELLDQAIEFSWRAIKK